MVSSPQDARPKNDPLDLRTVIETIPALVVCTTAEGSAEFANRAWLEFTGSSLREVDGSGWRNAIHPEDVDRVVDSSGVTLAPSRASDTEARLRSADGQYRWFLIRKAHAVSRNPGGVPSLRTLIACEDVDDRKRTQDKLRESEERYRLVVEAAADAVICTGEAGIIQFANPAAYRIFGYAPGSLVDEPLTVLMPQSLRGRHASGFSDYLTNRRRHLNWRGTEMTGLRSNGEEFPLEISFGEIAHERGITLIGFIRDISDKKRAEEERERLRRVQADLARISRVSTMGELTATLAHEIRQPIAAAVTNARTCMRWLERDRPEPDEAREAASRLIRDLTRASEVIHRIGALFKRNDLRREPVDVNALIREMIDLLEREATRYSVAVRSDLDAGLPEIMADRIALQQVLLNLLLNGIEAMKHSGGGELTIQSRHDEASNLVISVSDTGVGLQSADTEQIFNAFYTTKPEGTGMGLTVSRSIVEAHGGRLWAVANNGPGATFHFALPAWTAAPQPA